MRSSNPLQSIGPRLPLIIVTAIVLVLTLVIGASIGESQFVEVYLVFFCLGAFVAVLALGSKYWLLIPIAFSLNLPAIPFFRRAFDLPELAIMLCGAVFACRYALNPRGVTVFRIPHAGVMLYTAWAGTIFFLHPVGLSGMGSSLGGARFYFKIALALIAFLIMANQKITERDAKWLIRLLLIGAVVSTLINLGRYKLLGAFEAPDFGPEGYYTWHQELALPAMWITIWLVSRYKTKEVLSFSRPWLPLLLLVCIGIGAVSGKRAGFATVLLAPVIAAVIRKEYFYVVIGAILAAVLISVLTIGQGEWFKLPLRVQRVFSYLPGKWDWQVKAEFENGIDPFRAEMRRLAWNNIQRHPFVGEGYGVVRTNLVAVVQLYGLEAVTQNLAAGSSWHNTWLGIWADLGLPAALFWGVFWIQAVAIGIWLYKRTVHQNVYRTLGLMLLLSFVLAICRSWTSGHSAEDAFSTWWMFGVMVSLKYTLKATQPRRKEGAAPNNLPVEVVAV
jgi:hypothetical protein